MLFCKNNQHCENYTKHNDTLRIGMQTLSKLPQTVIPSTITVNGTQAYTYASLWRKEYEQKSMIKIKQEWCIISDHDRCTQL